MNKRHKPKVVILTGAGISAESGLKTFRDSNGLWEGHKVEDVATPEGFERNPSLVYDFYNQRRAQLQDEAVTPNPAHVALAQLEQALGTNCLVVTQNVDDLHERAGSHNVLHMHGVLNAARCCKTGISMPFNQTFDHTSPCGCCVPPQQVRPDIVWFGEIPMHMDQILSALEQADVFVSIGTSGNVYPAANFVQQASVFGAKTIEINLEASLNNQLFDQRIEGLASVTVPKFVTSFLTEYQL